MYAEFAKVAEGNEYAWSCGSPAATAEDIGGVTKKNRMICFPCKWSSMRYLLSTSMTDKRDVIDPMLMNAFNTVNLAAACILTSTEHARELGIPQDRWIYALGGAGTQDSSDCEQAFGCDLKPFTLY